MDPKVHLVTLFLVIKIICVQSVQFRDCGNGEVTSVRVEECDQDICVLTKGQGFKVELDFLPTKSAEKVTFHVSTSVFGFSVDLPVDNNDACGQNFIQCPVSAGQSTKFVYNGTIDESVPMSSASVTFTLKDENGESLACIESDFELADPDQDVHQEL